MRPGCTFPSGRVLRYTREDDRIVAVELERGWFRKRRERVRFRLSDDGLRWYWAESGVRLELASSGQWSALFEALGLHP